MSSTGPEAKAQSKPDFKIHRRPCVECERRKQKCSREWPCNNCQKRRVAEKCHFVTDQQNLPSDSSHRLCRLKLETEDELDGDKAPVEDVADDETAFKAMGYMRSSFIFNLSRPVELKHGSPAGDVVDRADLVWPMEKLPPPPDLDTLVSSFTETINFYYYMVYPPRLMEIYSTWREDIRLDKPLDPVATCLILRVCACAAQYVHPGVQGKMEAGLSMPAHRLSDLCNQAAVDLSSKIPAGKGGLLQVQQLLLTTCWHMSEALFVDCWHALGAAIREAQEIGLNTESCAVGLSDFDREMRRRAWCILDAWDWQMSILFARPLLIDRRDCHVMSPEVGLEGTPSPVYQMKLQYEVIRLMHRGFGNMNKEMTLAEVRQFQHIIVQWTESFPPMLRITEPDISMDEENKWITLHRRYLHAMACAMTLGPLKSYLCRTFDQSEPQEEQNLRSSGVDHSLKLHDANILLFHSIFPINAKYHFALFFLFDLALVLCSAIIHDKHSNLPKRNEVIGAIADVLEMLRHIRNVTGTASTSYSILSKLIRRLPISQDEIPIIRRQLITVKFDHHPAAVSAKEGPKTTVVQAASVARGQPRSLITPVDSTTSDNTSTILVSIDTKPETFDTGLPLVYPFAGHDAQWSPLLLISWKPILDVFLERFLDFYGPEMPSASQSLYWVNVGQPHQIWRLGAAGRTCSRLLYDSFTAVSTTHSGLSIGDWRLVSAGDRIYSSILGSLQTAVGDPKQSKSEEVLMAVTLCGVYEGMRRTGERAFLTHTLGALKLMEFRGAHRHTFGIAHWLFIELRSYWVFAAITTRSPTFLALPRWKSIPWSTGTTTKDLLQHLLDHMVDIPTLLSHADQIKDYSIPKPPAKVLRLQQELWTLATSIEQGLYQWKREWADRYPNGQAREVREKAEGAFPAFRCQDPVTGAVVYATTLVYPDPVFAQAMCHYYAALILVFSADTRPRDPELNDTYDLACLICRTMGYYVRTVPSCLASRVAFPFRVAYDSLPEGSMERRYIEEVFRSIGQRRFSTEWGCALEGLSVKS